MPDSDASLQPNRPGLGRRYLRWWVDDLPPIDGRLRFLFYAGLLILTQAHSKSFLLGIQWYEATDPELYHPRGLFGALGLTYLPPGTVRFVIGVTIVAWIFTAIGLFTRFSAVLTAAGVFFLHGLFLDTNAGNRTWVLPLYAILALCFASSWDTWSVDFHLRRKFRKPPVPKNARTSISRTGFARKLFLVAAVGFYTASGFSKLSSAGIAWADGRTLQFFAEGGDHFLASLLAENLWLCTLLSIAALLAEVLAFLALLSPRLRIVFLILWSLMHLGIRHSLGPWYGTNIWCFILLVNWQATFLWFRHFLLATRLTSRLTLREPVAEILEELEASAATPPRTSFVPGSPGGLSPAAARVAVAGGTTILGLTAAVAVFQIEWWPLTKVDMYSSYYSENIGADYPWGDYRDPLRAQRIARETSASRSSRLAQKELAFRVELLLVSNNGEALSLRDGIGVADSKQWFKCALTPVIVEDLASKPDGDLAWNPERPDTPATRFLWRILPAIKRNVPEWVDYDSAELTYELPGPDAVLARIPLHTAPPEPKSP